MKEQILLAMELDQALELCSKSGWEVKVIFTSPPRGEPGGVYRVVFCQESSDHSLLLIAAREMEREKSVNGL